MMENDLDIKNAHDYTFISDKQKGLTNAIQYHVEEAEHRHCLRHLHNNFSREFKGLAFKKMMYAIGKASRIVDWQKHMNDIQRLDANAHLWLSGMPAKRWSRSHFRCTVKCDVFLNNLCETFNKRILVARGKPIISLLEDIRQYINERIRKQRAACHNGNEIEVYHANGEKQVVDMKNKTCTCRKWQLTEIPCCHAVKGCKYRCQKPEDLVDDYYTKDTFMKYYNNVLHPPLPPEMWKTYEFMPIITPLYTTKR
ncbi:hypothetical protein LIER_13196 [Lithospermum erythrorhizon]|uniref:SWIM-type domain-containing protein n=1 Tax=Lithospermum erythrorhizon TaxID=34254 RepID=A0AAV3PYR1_LITER